MAKKKVSLYLPSWHPATGTVAIFTIILNLVVLVWFIETIQ